MDGNHVLHLEGRKVVDRIEIGIWVEEDGFVEIGVAQDGFLGLAMAGIVVADYVRWEQFQHRLLVHRAVLWCGVDAVPFQTP